MMSYLNLIRGIIVIGTFLLSPTLLWCGNIADNSAGIEFKRVNEPKEQAFSILIPKDWQVEGGIAPDNDLPVDWPLNFIETPCDMVIKSDAKGTVAYRIFPEIVYAHEGIGDNYIPVGGNYQGVKIRPIVSATTFLTNLFSSLHSDVNALKSFKIKRVSEEMEALDQGLAAANRLFTQIGFQSISHRIDAAGAIFEYMEEGTRYREILITGIINMPDELIWKNARTISFRAPVEQFEKWRPVMDAIRFSVRYNPKWVLKKCRGRREYADIVMTVFEEIRRINKQILKNRNTTLPG